MTDEALIRWETIRRDHLSGAIALLFGVSSGALAFCASLLTQESVKLGGARTIYYLTAISSFLLAELLSLVVVFIRLQDVRITTQLIREQKNQCKTKQIEILRQRAQWFGRQTWRLFHLQLFALLTGTAFLFIALWNIFYSKLFP